MLNNDGTVSHQNAKTLGIEMFNVGSGGNPEIVSEILCVRNEGFYLKQNEVKWIKNLRDFKTAIKNENQLHIHVELAKHISALLVSYKSAFKGFILIYFIQLYLSTVKDLRTNKSNGSKNG